MAANTTFCSNCGAKSKPAEAGDGPAAGVVVGTPDDEDASDGQTMVMQVDLSLFDDEQPAVDIVDPRRAAAPPADPRQSAAPPGEGASAPPTATAAPPAQTAGDAPARRAPAKTMIGIPLAEQLAKQESAAASTARPQPQAPRPAAAAPATGPGQRPGAPARPSTKTMVGMPLAEQLAQQGAPPRAAAPQPAGGPGRPAAPPGPTAPARPAAPPRPSTKTMVGVPLAEQLEKQAAAAARQQATEDEDRTAMVSPDQLGLEKAGDFADDDDRTSMMPAFSLEALEKEVAKAEAAKAAAAHAAAAVPAAAVPPIQEPEPTPFAEDEPEATVAVGPPASLRDAAPARGPQEPAARPAAVGAGDDAERPLPALPAWTAPAEALQPPPAPTALFGAMGYAFKTFGLGGRIRKNLATRERRRELLASSREEVLVSAGQRAWEEGIPASSLEAHRSAIEQARSASHDLEDQIAALDKTVADEEAKAKADIDARTQKVEGLERQHSERDRVFQQTSREHKEATQTLKDTEKEIATLEKTYEKLTSTPDDKKAPDHAEKLAESEREHANLQEHLPGLQARVEEMTQRRDEQKDEVAGLRNQIKDERAAIAEVEKALKQHVKEVEGQKAQLRGEIAGAEAGMRGPLLAAGQELFAERGRCPTLSTFFASVDEHDAALAEDAVSEEGYRTVERAYQPAVARKGWAIVGISALVLTLIVVVAVLVLGGGGGGSGLSSGVRNAIPKDVGGVASVDVSALLDTPLAKRLGDKVGDKLSSEMGQAGQVMKALDAKPSDVKSVTVGLRFPKGEEPLALGVIDAHIDAAKVAEVFKKEGFEERTTDSGAIRLVKRDKNLVLTNGLFLIAEGDAEALLSDSPLLKGEGAASVAENETLTALMGEIDTGATAWAVFVVPEGMERELRGSPVEIKPGDRIAMSVDLSGGITAIVYLAVTEEARAEQIEQIVKAGIEQGKSQIDGAAAQFPPAAGLIDDVKKVMDDVSVKRSGPSVRIEVRVPQALIDRALDLFEPMLGMAMQGGL